MLINSKVGLVLLLLVVFAVNLAETKMVASLHNRSPVSATEYKVASVVQKFERGIVNFEFHDETSTWAAYAYSVSYFFLLPAIGVAILFALGRREELAPFRVFCLAITIDYLASLMCFLL